MDHVTSRAPCGSSPSSPAPGVLRSAMMHPANQRTGGRRHFQATVMCEVFKPPTDHSAASTKKGGRTNASQCDAADKHCGRGEPFGRALEYSAGGLPCCTAAGWKLTRSGPAIPPGPVADATKTCGTSVRLSLTRGRRPTTQKSRRQEPCGMGGERRGGWEEWRREEQIRFSAREWNESPNRLRRKSGGRQAGGRAPCGV